MVWYSQSQIGWIEVIEERIIDHRSRRGDVCLSMGMDTRPGFWSGRGQGSEMCGGKAGRLTTGVREATTRSRTAARISISQIFGGLKGKPESSTLVWNQGARSCSLPTCRLHPIHVDPGRRRNVLTREAVPQIRGKHWAEGVTPRI